MLNENPLKAHIWNEKKITKATWEFPLLLYGGGNQDKKFPDTRKLHQEKRKKIPGQKNKNIF